MHQRRRAPQTTVEHLAAHATAWVGSAASLVTHTAVFIAAFVVMALGAPRDTVLLVLTTIVSLEAIYLSIFIQMSVNRSNSRLAEVSEDIEEVKEEVEEIGEDIDEIQKDVDEIQADVEEMQEDVEDIQEEVIAIGDDVGDISEDLEEDVRAEVERDQELLQRFEQSLGLLMTELQELRATQKKKAAPVKKQASKK